MHNSASAADELVTDIQIDASPDRVFEALVDPAQVPQWWGQAGIYRCTAFEIDRRVGGTWQCSGVGGDGSAFTISGKILEIDPPRVLAYTWKATWTGAFTTAVRWELTPAGGGTRVRVRHTGLAAKPELAQSYRGWPRMLGWLQRFIQHGETVGDRGTVG